MRHFRKVNIQYKMPTDIKSIRLLRGQSQEVLTRFIQCAVVKHYQTNEAISWQAGPCEFVYFILKGEVEIYRLSPAGRELAQELEKLFTPLENTIREMFYKEEHILLPNALERLTDADWRAIYTQEEEFGFSFATRVTGWQDSVVQIPIEKDTIIQNTQPERTEPMSDFPLTNGDLTIKQIDMMLKNLPVDITFVDENDTVRYYSETPERIFKRTAAIIGRKVQNCHPLASVDKVVKIVEDFRAGKRDVAEFWIQMKGKFIHIRYFAMRDAAGAYKGTLEVSQDLTELRKLEGEKRLLDD